MNDQRDSFDEKLDRRLKALPERPAPPELVGNVLRGIRQYEARPWWQRAWFEWPLGIRWASALLACAWLLLPGLMDLSALKTGIDPLLSLLQSVGALLRPVVESGLSALSAIPVYLRWLLALAFGLCWLGTMAVGLICLRLARHRKEVRQR